METRDSTADVLLINPQVNYEEFFGRVSGSIQRYAPLNLTYLAGYLEARGIGVQIYDGQIEGLAEERLLGVLKRLRPRVVGITCSTPLVGAALKIAALSKSAGRDARIILGGAHPTAFPEEMLNNPGVDAVAFGEAESTLHEFVEAVKKGGAFHPIQGIAFKENGRTVKNPARALLTDLDQLPFPSTHLIPIDAYPPALDLYFKSPSASMITSRGCPYKCIFCAGRLISGHRYRTRSPDNVLEEIRLLTEQYKVRNIVFMDDHFFFDRERTERICDLLIEEGLHKRLTWICAGRTDMITEPLLKKMRRAGCRLICYGIETGSQRLMDILKKKINLDKVPGAVKMTRRAGIKTRGTFVLGIPTETREETLQTIRFAREIGIDFAKFNLITPYPGTELYQICRDMGLDFSDNWEKLIPAIGFSDEEPTFIPEGRTGQELKALQRQATRAFYLRPRQMMNMIQNIRNFRDLKRYFVLARAVIQRSSSLKPAGS
jgi:radical SAM superfamily enzyme YgiQ (UPF0313 family)